MEESIARKRKKESKRNAILETARVLFCEKGIEETSIEDVAKKAGVGAATVYRYFLTKAGLAIEAATAYWGLLSEKYTRRLESSSYCSLSGVQQLEVVFGIFSEIFEEEEAFLKFLQEFDVFIKKYNIAQEQLQEYENSILSLKKYVTDALEKGLKDQTLSFSYSMDEIYFTITHTMLSLMEKMAANGMLLSSDERVAAVQQVKITGELLKKGLERKKI